MKPNFRYQGEYKSEYQQRIAETVEYILDKEKGDTIEYGVLAQMLHYNIEDELENKKFKSTMNRIRNILIDFGYVLKNVTGVGYYILKTKQISGFCYHTYIRKTTNLLDKSARILSHAQVGELTDIRKEEYDNLCDLNLETTAVIENAIENSAYYNRKAYYDSLED